MKNLQYIRQAQYKQGFVVPALLAIIAVLVIGGGVYVYNDKKEAKVEESTAVDAEVQQSGQVQQQTNTQTQLVNTQTKVCSNGGMSLRVPDRSSYRCENNEATNGAWFLLDVGYIDRESMSGMSDSGGLPGIMNIKKFKDKETFEDIKSIEVNLEYYTLIDNNYPISGTIGLYYKSKPGAFGDGEGDKVIVVPSKFIIVHIDSLDSLAKVYKMNNKLRDLLKIERDSIIKSISL